MKEMHVKISKNGIGDMMLGGEVCIDLKDKKIEDLAYLKIKLDDYCGLYSGDVEIVEENDWDW